MKISVIAAGELDAGACAAWLALQYSNPALGSPFFSPGFTLAAGETCPDVRIAVLEDSRGIAGFFPFQSRWTIGAPVGRLLSDHHGVVCAPGTRWDWGELLRATGLSCWRFDALCAAQGGGSRSRQVRSPGLDLSRGYAAYRDDRLALHGEWMRSFERKARKLQREQGPLRFVDNLRDAAMFDAVLAMKSAQYRRTGSADVFRLQWPRDLLERIRQADQPDFGGRLSVLFAGDQLVAAHFGMRSATVWHSWFHVYENSFSRYSPGAQLLLRIAAAAAQQGHAVLDLGKGEEPYKGVFADHATPLLEGTFTRSAAVSSLVDAPYRAARWVLATRMGQGLRPLVRRARGL